MSTMLSTAVAAPPPDQRFASVLLADGRALACKVAAARTFLERGRGLLGRPRLLEGQALWIAPCPSIHTVGMRYAIDVVFLDADNRVLRLACRVPPIRFRLCRGAVSVVELLADQAAALGLRKGQQLAASRAPDSDSDSDRFYPPDH